MTQVKTTMDGRAIPVDLNKVTGDEQVSQPHDRKIVAAVRAEIDAAQQVSKTTSTKMIPR